LEGLRKAMTNLTIAVSGLKFDPAISLIRSRSAKYSAAMFYSPPVVMGVKQSRMRWSVYVARMGVDKCTRFRWETRREMATCETDWQRRG
jgi:hypothetical protein